MPIAFSCEFLRQWIPAKHPWHDGRKILNLKTRKIFLQQWKLTFHPHVNLTLVRKGARKKFLFDPWRSVTSWSQVSNQVWYQLTNSSPKVYPHARWRMHSKFLQIKFVFSLMKPLSCLQAAPPPPIYTRDCIKWTLKIKIGLKKFQPKKFQPIT